MLVDVNVVGEAALRAELLKSQKECDALEEYILKKNEQIAMIIIGCVIFVIVFVSKVFF